MNSTFKCCICYDNLITYISCTTCNIKICFECLANINKNLELIEDKININFKCPVCCQYNIIDLFDKIYYIHCNNIIKKYFILLINSNINNINLINIYNKEYYIYKKLYSNIYNICKYIFIIDKILFSIIYFTTFVYIYNYYELVQRT